MTTNDEYQRYPGIEKLTAHLETRVTPAFRQRVDALAKKERRNRAGMVRRLIEAGMEQLAPEACVEDGV